MRETKSKSEIAVRSGSLSVARGRMPKSIGALGGALLFIAAMASAQVLPPPGPKPPEANQQLARDILKQIVEIRSVHDVGTGDVAEALAARFRAAGFTDSEIHTVPEVEWPKQVNLVVRLRGKRRGKPVMWICHMDVVDARPQDWSLPPFKFTEKDGYFYGRGTSDMKDEDAAVAASLIRLKQEGFVPDRDIIAAFTADEEVGLEQDGPAYLLKHDRDLVDAGLVMNPDGGSGQILNGRRVAFGVETVQKTYMTFQWETTNKGGHSSEPRPDNAIYELANGLTRLSQYQFPYKTNATTRAYFAAMAQMSSGQKKTDLLALSREPLDEAAAARVAARSGDECHPAYHLRRHHVEGGRAGKCAAVERGRDGSMPRIPQRDGKADLGDAREGGWRSQHQGLADGACAARDRNCAGCQSDGRHHKGRAFHVAGRAGAAENGGGCERQHFHPCGGNPSYGVGGGWDDLNDLRMHGRDERKEIDDFYSTVEFTYRLMKELSTAPR